MLQNKFEKRLDLTLKPSKLFLLYLFALFLCMILSLFFFNGLNLTTQFLFFVFVLVIAVLVYLTNKNKNITHITLSVNSEWKVTINNEIYNAELCSECIVTSFFVWLNFFYVDATGKKRICHVLILPDSVDADLIRQLRIRLLLLIENNETT